MINNLTANSAPPITETDIVNLGRKTSHNLPADIRKSYLKHNGEMAEEGDRNVCLNDSGNEYTLKYIVSIEQRVSDCHFSEIKHLGKGIIILLLFIANVCRADGLNTGVRDTLIILTDSSDTACVSRLVLDKGCVQDTLVSIYCADGSDIEPLEELNRENERTQIDVFAVYNAAADGSKYVFYNHQTQRAYITFATFSDINPTSVFLEDTEKYVLLRNKSNAAVPLNDTLDVGTREEYIANGSKYRSIKAGVKTIKSRP